MKELIFGGLLDHRDGIAEETLKLFKEIRADDKFDYKKPRKTIEVQLKYILGELPITKHVNKDKRQYKKYSNSLLSVYKTAKKVRNEIEEYITVDVNDIPDKLKERIKGYDPERPDFDSVRELIIFGATNYIYENLDKID